MPRAVGRLAVASVLVMVMGRGAPALQPSLEYEVKAAYLANFLRFIQWPAQAAPGPAESAASICIVGRSTFAPIVEKAIEGETVGGRALTVRLIREQDIDARSAAGACRMIFVSREAAALTPRLRRAHPAGALFVGESPRFLRDGGHIQLVVDAGRVQFDLNMEAAQAAGLTISSRLARLARNAVALQNR